MTVEDMDVKIVRTILMKAADEADRLYREGSGEIIRDIANKGVCDYVPRSHGAVILDNGMYNMMGNKLNWEIDGKKFG